MYTPIINILSRERSDEGQTFTAIISPDFRDRYFIIIDHGFSFSDEHQYCLSANALSWTYDRKRLKPTTREVRFVDGHRAKSKLWGRTGVFGPGRRNQAASVIWTQIAPEHILSQPRSRRRDVATCDAKCWFASWCTVTAWSLNGRVFRENINWCARFPNTLVNRKRSCVEWLTERRMRRLDHLVSHVVFLYCRVETTIWSRWLSLKVVIFGGPESHVCSNNSWFTRFLRRNYRTITHFIIYFGDRVFRKPIVHAGLFYNIK